MIRCSFDLAANGCADSLCPASGRYVYHEALEDSDGDVLPERIAVVDLF